MVIGIGGLMLQASREDAAGREWIGQSWDFTKQIMPLLLGGVMVAGMLLGRPGHEGLIPSQWVVWAVGDNSFASTLLASLLGAFMYFSTLTEVPIVEGLLGAGMGKGPALAILLAGPALSQPNMLVIRTVLGTQKTLVYCTLVVVTATLSGYFYGQLM
ncbi:permease [Stutzerimonas stutzeri]|uniref:Permease n=1 Tax=Stutzerimonas stutzeri TaxID=316 RepID=A0ABD4XY59_STUST|nr:permease [Stutzerimonas stutzeri]MDH0687803.1 permease [Stutzerimonas stutzeri]